MDVFVCYIYFSVEYVYEYKLCRISKKGLLHFHLGLNIVGCVCLCIKKLQKGLKFLKTFSLATGQDVCMGKNINFALMK